MNTVVTGTREEINSKWVNIRVSTLKSTNVERNNEKVGIKRGTMGNVDACVVCSGFI
jgi:hypothetical protein